jgi:hypothetical protein
MGSLHVFLWDGFIINNPHDNSKKNIRSCTPPPLLFSFLWDKIYTDKFGFSRKKCRRYIP